jgi:hypothetical protein
MNTSQTKTVFFAVIVVAMAWLVSPLLFSFREQALPVSTVTPSFDESRAYGFVQEFVTQFPNRVFGTFESRPATGYLHDHLEKLGYSVSYSHFDARIGRKQVGRNILAYRQGANPEILALAAHIDTTRTTVQGAMDNGSGVGVLLELAGIFAATPTHRSLLILFTDGEEWGMLGARDLVQTYPERNRIAAVLSLDHISIGNLKAFCLNETGQLKGFTPPWLRQIAREAAAAQALPVRGPTAFSEYLERALLISWGDQGPFLSAGIPAINLGSEAEDRSREKDIHYSSQDTIGNMKQSSIGQFGRAAERIVRTLDELHAIPREASSPLRLWDARYLRAEAITVLQIISFLPLTLALWFLFRNHGGRLTGERAGREFLAFLGTVLPFWILYFAMGLARALRRIPIYAVYPPPPRDPVLESPAWGVLAAVFGTALFAAVVFYIIAKFSFGSMSKPDFHVSKLVLLSLLMAVVAIALSYNPYWASIFLTLPAWIWALTGLKSNPGARALNRIIIVAAGTVYYAALLLYGSRLGLGWNFAWYHVLALSNGLFTQTAFFLATAIIAIGIRFLAIQSAMDRCNVELRRSI